MGRKSKTAAGKKGGAAKKSALNKSKKDKNIFKVGDGKNKSKKPKEVQGKLKKIKEAVQKKQEKVDADLKHLHKDLVVKKPKAANKPSIRSNKRAPANTKNVAEKLGNLQV